MQSLTLSDSPLIKSCLSVTLLKPSEFPQIYFQSDSSLDSQITGFLPFSAFVLFPLQRCRTCDHLQDQTQLQEPDSWRCGRESRYAPGVLWILTPKNSLVPEISKSSNCIYSILMVYMLSCREELPGVRDGSEGAAERSWRGGCLGSLNGG